MNYFWPIFIDENVLRICQKCTKLPIIPRKIGLVPRFKLGGGPPISKSIYTKFEAYSSGCSRGKVEKVKKFTMTMMMMTITSRSTKTMTDTG